MKLVLLLIIVNVAAISGFQDDFLDGDYFDDILDSKEAIQSLCTRSCRSDDGRGKKYRRLKNSCKGKPPGCELRVVKLCTKNCMLENGWNSHNLNHQTCNQNCRSDVEVARMYKYMVKKCAGEPSCITKVVRKCIDQCLYEIDNLPAEKPRTQPVKETQGCNNN